MGHPSLQTDPSGVQSILSYYGDGTLQSLTVPSLSNLAAKYSYRADGLLQTKAFTYPGVSNSLAYTYTAVGRYNAMADFSAKQSQTVAYDANGRIFPNEASAIRMVAALLAETNDDWQERAYFDMSEYHERRAAANGAGPPLTSIEKTRTAA